MLPAASRAMSINPGRHKSSHLLLQQVHPSPLTKSIQLSESNNFIWMNNTPVNGKRSCAGDTRVVILLDVSGWAHNVFTKLHSVDESGLASRPT